jgi:CubicO group peptidase (beta-lactamase class C family)
VADAFATGFAEHGEVGAAVCVYADGRKVLDLWGGVADVATGRPWAEDTIVMVFSSTKGVTAVAANLAIERGLLDPDVTVASYWSEFAAGGKEAVTVRQVLTTRPGCRSSRPTSR